MFSGLIRFGIIVPLVALMVVMDWGVVSAETSGPQSTVITVDRADDQFETCSRDTADCPHCTDGDDNDCTLRWAIEEANALGGPVEITFTEAFQIELQQRALPAITANDVTINPPPNLTITVDGNGITKGFTLSAANTTLDAIRMENFSGEYITIDVAATGARIANTFLVGPDCSLPASNTATGISIAGDLNSIARKANIWRTTISCMGDAGLLVENARYVSIGRRPDTSSTFVNGNNFLFNGTGIRLINACNLTEEHSEITMNEGDGVYIAGCSNITMSDSIITDNGGAGIRYVTAGLGAPRTVPKEVQNNGGPAILLESASGGFRPIIFNHNPSTNVVSVSFSVTAEELHLFKLSDGDSESDGSSVFYVDSFNLGSTQVNRMVDLDDYPDLTPSTIAFMSTSGSNGSKLSELYMPQSPTAVTLQTQQERPVVAHLATIAFGLAIVSRQVIRNRKKRMV